MNKDKCADCGKEQEIADLIQVKDQYPNQPRYKMVCEDCFKKKGYEFIGKFTL